MRRDAIQQPATGVWRTTCRVEPGVGAPVPYWRLEASASVAASSNDWARSDLVRPSIVDVSGRVASYRQTEGGARALAEEWSPRGYPTRVHAGTCVRDTGAVMAFEGRTDAPRVREA